MPVYLDNAATTRVCPEAARAALEAMTEGYGNPSSGYALGQAAAAALKEHRAAVAGRLGCAPEELIFTSSPIGAATCPPTPSGPPCGPIRCWCP